MGLIGWASLIKAFTPGSFVEKEAWLSDSVACRGRTQHFECSWMVGRFGHCGDSSSCGTVIFWSGAYQGGLP